MFLFKRMFKVSLPSAVTAMLPAADSNVFSCSSVTPSPLTLTVELSLFLFTTLSLLPVNFKPSSVVATSCLFLLLSS